MTDFVVGLLTTLAMIASAGVWHALVLRKRHGGGVPLPAFLIRAEHASPALRELVARMARASAKDVLAEWGTLPPALQTTIRMQIRMMVVEELAIHERDGETST